MAPREPQPWGRALLGGLMVALGGALFGAGRRAPAPGKPAAGRPSAGRTAGKGRGVAKPVGKPSSKRRPGADTPRVRTKPKAPAAAVRTRYWPPPPPTPITVPERDADARPVDARSVELGYERVDVKPGTIATVMLASASVLAVSIAVLFFLIGQVHRADRQAPSLTQQQLAVIVPPGPHLQDHPLHDIAVELKRETDRLASYAWADPQHRAARIPIGRAEALVIGRPLDASPPAASPAAVPAGQP